MVVPSDIAYRVDVVLLVGLAVTEFLLLWCIARDLERRQERARAQEAVIDNRLQTLSDRDRAAEEMSQDGRPFLVFTGA